MFYLIVHAIGGKGSAVGVPWFGKLLYLYSTFQLPATETVSFQLILIGIFLQLWVIITVFYTLATDSVGGNRFQVSSK